MTAYAPSVKSGAPTHVTILCVVNLSKALRTSFLRRIPYCSRSSKFDLSLSACRYRSAIFSRLGGLRGACRLSCIYNSKHPEYASSKLILPSLLISVEQNKLSTILSTEDLLLFFSLLVTDVKECTALLPLRHKTGGQQMKQSKLIYFLIAAPKALSILTVLV